MNAAVEIAERYRQIEPKRKVIQSVERYLLKGIK
jgi:hypothetical protein